MKQAFIILAILIVLPLVYLIRNHTNYGAALPPGLPADVPIVEGQIISGRRTLFEDGRGYVVDLRSDLSYDEVLKFYTESVGSDRVTDEPGMGTAFSVADFHIGNTRVLLEIHSRDATTYVTTAIHLGRWL
jgi:hypothetical protein